jgi:hypothetical protein
MCVVKTIFNKEYVAQLVEQWTFNPQVLGSNPSVLTKAREFNKKNFSLASITQLVRVLGCGSKSHRFKSCYSPF